MTIVEYIQAKLFKTRMGYWTLLRWLAWTCWAGMIKPGVFGADGERVENAIANGTLRIFLGGVLMVSTGWILMGLGVLATLMLLVLIVTLPITTLFLLLAARYKQRSQHKMLAAAVSAAKEARRHG